MLHSEDLYLSDDEIEDSTKNEEIEIENEYCRKIDILLNFKNDISMEPEFIGIKNINCQIILDIIENTFYKNKIHKYILTKDQMRYFKKLYFDLKIDYINEDIIQTVVNKIFNKIYI